MTQNQNANTPTTRKEIPEILRGKRYLDPSYDPAFYALLDDEEALADFINSLLHLEDGRKIKSMKYTFNQPLILRAPEAKEIKFDIHAWTEDNRCMDIEIQRASHPFFTDRVLLYGAYLTIDGKIKMDKSATASTSLNLIGETVDEAMLDLDKYLDDVYLAHIPTVTIIHGRGTGALRSAVREFLRKDRSRISGYREAEYDEGGYGVTIVTFK